MKLCKDCTHYMKRGEWSNYDRCNRKNLIDPSVNNEMTKLCHIQREDGWLFARFENTCGREGRFFQPKDTTNDTP